MRTPVLLLVVSLFLPLLLRAQTPPISGRWVGEMDLQGETTVFRLSVPRGAVRRGEATGLAAR